MNRAYGHLYLSRCTWTESPSSHRLKEQAGHINTSYLFFSPGPLLWLCTLTLVHNTASAPQNRTRTATTTVGPSTTQPIKQDFKSIQIIHPFQRLLHNMSPGYNQHNLSYPVLDDRKWWWADNYARTDTGYTSADYLLPSFTWNVSSPHHRKQNMAEAK